MPSQKLLRILTIVLFCALAACSGKRPPAYPNQPAYQGPGEVQDIRSLPQDLNRYTGSTPNRQLMDSSSQAQQKATYLRKYYSPWHMTKPSVGKSEVMTMLNRKARGYKDGSTRWQNKEWADMKANAGMKAWPSLSAPGITLRETDLREMPTRTPRFTKPTPVPSDDPFDYFQYSRLHAGMPVLLCHQTSDGKWIYVETPLVSGWVAAADLAQVTPDFTAAWEGSPLAAVTSDHQSLGGNSGQANVGALFPLVSKSGNATTVRIPVRGGDGFAKTRNVTLTLGGAERWPLRMTPANVARVGNTMLGQKYGWGGYLGLRDCSATTRDLMTPFGIWLARNSKPQGRTGYPISLSAMSEQEKEQTVLRSGVPFASLLVLPGHVVFYVGEYRGRPVIMHNIWGIRVDEPADEDQRLIIGRNVITYLTPGAELPNLHNGMTIGDRFTTLTILGNAQNQ